MDIVRILLLISSGGAIWRFVKCYSDGILDDIPNICETMEVDHFSIPQQNTNPPFRVEPKCINVTDATKGQNFVVSLRADPHREFQGFMLKASIANNRDPMGTFTLMDQTNSHLLSCAGIPGKAVTQKNNRLKTNVTVQWSTSEPDFYCFRVTFVQNFQTFWVSTMEASSTPAPVTSPASSVMASATHLTSGVSTEGITSAHTTITSAHTSMPTTEPPDFTVVTEATPLTSVMASATHLTSGVSTEGITSAHTTITSAHTSMPTTEPPDFTVNTEATPLTSVMASATHLTSGVSTEGITSAHTTITSAHTSMPTTEPPDFTVVTEATPLTSVMASATHLTSGVSTEGITSAHTTITSAHTSMPTTEPPDFTVNTEATPLTSVMASATHLTSGVSTEGITSAHTTITSAHTSMPTTEPPDFTVVTEAPTTEDGRMFYEISLILSILNYLSLAECLPFLMKHRKRRSITCIMVMSFLSLVFSLVAFILSLISAKQVASSILAGLAVVLSMCQTFLMMNMFLTGPSHELRRLYCWSFGLVAFANLCLTTATTFVELVEFSSWLPVVMGVYVTCTLLLFASYICKKFKKKKDAVNKKRVSWYCVVLSIITVVNIVFSAALTIGTLLCRDK